MRLQSYWDLRHQFKRWNFHGLTSWDECIGNYRTGWRSWSQRRLIQGLGTISLHQFHMYYFLHGSSKHFLRRRWISTKFESSGKSTSEVEIRCKSQALENAVPPPTTIQQFATSINFIHVADRYLIDILRGLIYSVIMDGYGFVQLDLELNYLGQK